jgi:geranylgeranyl diphosphate synthase type II
MTSLQTIPELQAKINQAITTLHFGDQPANLYDPINYIMTLGGKRLRPLLSLLSYQLGGSDPGHIIRQSLAIEIFHNFTLVHDDVMDRAPLRRGKETVHEKWNNTIAILSGDTMLVKAYELLAEVNSAQLPFVLQRFNQTAIEVCEGQQMDMDFETQEFVQEQQYLEMIRLKTAVLLGFSMEFGGILAGFDKQKSNALFQMGETMGVGFQLMDDYLDVYADKAKFGKQVGGDIISNKKTYLLIKALDQAKGEQKKELLNWITKEHFNPEDKVMAITHLYNEIGIPELTLSKMNFYFDQALGLLDRFEADETAKNMISQFAKQLMKRDK